MSVLRELLPWVEAVQTFTPGAARSTHEPRIVLVDVQLMIDGRDGNSTRIGHGVGRPAPAPFFSQSGPLFWNSA